VGGVRGARCLETEDGHGEKGEWSVARQGSPGKEFGVELEIRDGE
jgi:hypothetical protein